MGVHNHITKLEIEIPEPVHCIALSKSMCYFYIMPDKLCSFSFREKPIHGVIPFSKVKIEHIPDIIQITCGDEFIAILNNLGEVYVRGSPFTQSFIKVRRMPYVVSITAAPNFLFAIVSTGRFCIVTDHTIIYQKRRHPERWYVAVAMFLGTVLLLGHTGGAYTMAFNTDNPTITEPLQVYYEDSCIFTALYSCHESLFFLTSDDDVVSYGYNHYGCLGVGHGNTVNNLFRYKPALANETIAELAPSTNYTFFLTHLGHLYVSGKAPHHPLTISSPSLYDPLDGHYITQVKSNCGISIALECGHPDFFNIATPPGKYKNFPIPRAVTFFSNPEGLPLAVFPFKDDYSHSPYFPGDIIIDNDTKGKVIGLDSSENFVVAMAELKRVTKLQGLGQYIEHDYLVKRPGTVLKEIKYNVSRTNQVTIKIDPNPNIIFKFSGLMYGDIIVDDHKQEWKIVGARGKHLWCKNVSNGSFECFTETAIMEMKSDEKQAFKIIDANGDSYWITELEESERTDDLFESSEFGLCKIIGNKENEFVYKMCGSQKNYCYSKSKLPIARSQTEPTKVKVILRDYSIIDVEICYSETIGFGFVAYDRIKTKEGYATFVGSYQEKAVIIYDKEYISTSYADIIEYSEMELIGRIDNQNTTKKYFIGKNQPIELLINIGAFEKTEFCIADRVIHNNGKKAMVCGIKDGIVYCKDDNESIVIPVCDDDRIVCRYMMVGYWKVLDGMKIRLSFCSFGGAWIKPGDFYKDGEMKMGCIGINNESKIVFKIISPDQIFTLPISSYDLSDIIADEIE